MTIACKGIDILKRVLCLLLCFVVLFCFFMVPRAGAVAVEAATVAYAGALVGTILVGAGVLFSSGGDMAAVGSAMYKSLSNSSSAIASKISAVSSWAVSHGTKLASSAYRVGKDVFAEIVNAFKATYSNGKVSPVVSAHDTYIERYYTAEQEASVRAFFAAHPSEMYFTDPNYVDGSRHWRLDISADRRYIYWRSCSPTGSITNIFKTFQIPQAKAEFKSAYFALNQFSSIISADIWAVWVDADGKEYKDRFASNYGCVLPGYYSTSTFYLPVSCTAPSSDLKYPSDDFLVRMPDLPQVDSVTGSVTYSSDMPYTADSVAAPYPVDSDGVKVPDLPYDVPVDQTTGKDLTDSDTDIDTDTGTDSKPDTGTDTKPGESTNTDTDVSWPDAPSLSLPKLIASKFPFCTPFDVARLIGLLEAEPKAPRWVVPLQYADIVDEEIVLDFDDFSDVLRIVRWGEIMLFVAGLIVITRNYIKW